jgi:uncharacterized Fe-S center protein
MDPTVFFIPVEPGEPLSLVASKSVRIFTESGLDSKFDKGQLVAVKQHFGEHLDGHYVKPEITAGLVARLKSCEAEPFLTDTCTLYTGGRSNGIRHTQKAHTHGFTLEKVDAPFIPADGIRGIESVSVPINGKHFKEVQIASAVYYADSALVLTHITGHCQAGYGGALKNIAMGMVPRSAKMLQHFQATPKQNTYRCLACGACVRWCPSGAIEMVEESGRRFARIDPKKCIGCGECIAFCKAGVMSFEWSLSGPGFIERMVEHALGYLQIKRDKTVFINYAMEITRDCDCERTEKPDLQAVGIVAGSDLLACEQATIDLINRKTKTDYFAQLWPGYDYTFQLAYAEKLGMGSRKYELVELG